jgi:hypothetical protein
MIIGRFIGWLLLLAGAIVLMRDLISWLDTSNFEPISAGTLWSQMHGRSRDLAEIAIHDHLAPWLWDRVAAPILRGWAVAVLALPGLVLIWVFQRRNGTRRRRRR